MNANILHVTLLIIMTSVSLFAQINLENTDIRPLEIGEKIEFQSTILNEKRRLNVYLPHGYCKDSSKVYPVIYLLDGSMDEDFIHISGLVQFGSFSWINMLPESIVVGISNVDRKRDFTFPTLNKEDKVQFPTTGKSEDFIKFIEREAITYIEGNYKVASTRTLIGQSLGGLLATEILFKKPELFNNYIILSPSLWWDDQSLLAVTPKTYNTKKSVFIGVGKEGYGMEEMAKALYDKLLLIKGASSELYFKYFEEQDHGDVLHLGVYNAFEKIFDQKEK